MRAHPSGWHRFRQSELPASTAHTHVPVRTRLPLHPTRSEWLLALPLCPLAPCRYWLQTLYADSYTTDWDFKSESVDAVVINLGACLCVFGLAVAWPGTGVVAGRAAGVWLHHFLSFSLSLATHFLDDDVLGSGSRGPSCPIPFMCDTPSNPPLPRRDQRFRKGS